MADECTLKGKTRYYYTGNQVGFYNYTGFYNFVAGGPPGSGLSAGVTVPLTFPTPLNRRPWLKADARFTQDLLDACYPVIELQWIFEIELEPGVLFRLSDKPIYVQDEDGIPRYYDPRCEVSPNTHVTIGEWLQPQYEISNLQLTLNNRDGFFNQYLPNGANWRQWSGAKVLLRVGFGEKYSNYMTMFEGFVTEKKGMETTRDSIKIVAYDKLDDSQIPIPPSVYSKDTYPDVQSDYEGNAVPVIYGDWTVNVGDYGSIVGTCINATDDEADQYLFKISDTELQSIDEIWLHRGKRKAGEPDGPIKLDVSSVTLQEDQGRFIIPLGTTVFETEVPLYDNIQAGVGSGLNQISAKDATVDFLKLRIQPNDRVLQRRTGAYSIVSAVTSVNLMLTGGATYLPDDEVVIFTTQYAFIDGDKFSIKCKGKNLNLLQVTRLLDINEDVLLPNAVSISFDKTFWIADDDSQKLYNLTFDRKTKKTVDYTAIDPGLTSVSGISIASDNKIWVTDPINSKIYRYNLVNNTTGLSVSTTTITGIMSSLGNISGIQSKLDNNVWIVDQTSGNFYEINFFDAVNPFVENTFNKSAFDSSATEILDVTYDEVNNQVIAIDRNNNLCYRLNEVSGTLISSFSLTLLADNVSFVTGVSYAQDGTLFFVDQATLSVYNYYELTDAFSNPCVIARDLLQKFGGFTHADFDLTWNVTANQLIDYKCRVALTEKQQLVKYVSTLLQQFNIAFFIRFGKFGLFWIEFNNFRTDGMLTTEKDIKDGSFNPSKEYNQYFNSANAKYDFRPFSGDTRTSDTYVSPAGIAFIRKEVSKKLDLNNVYRREELDKLIPLFVRLAVPEPEFVKVTFGFRHIRSQIHDFLNLWFDSDVVCSTGKKIGGRRFDHVPTMIRDMTFNLSTMSIDMKLWSLGSTSFNGHTPVGPTIGGQFDPIVLSNIGRPAHISPIGTITSSVDNTVDLDIVLGEDAETRTTIATGLAWDIGYFVGIYDSATKQLIETLEISDVVGNTVYFVETPVTTIVPTTYNICGFITGGHYIAHAYYADVTELQKKNFAWYGRPINNYPTTRTQEIEEQRGGLHSFDDGGAPYIIYPLAYVSY